MEAVESCISEQVDEIPNLGKRSLRLTLLVNIFTGYTRKYTRGSDCTSEHLHRIHKTVHKTNRLSFAVGPVVHIECCIMQAIVNYYKDEPAENYTIVRGDTTDIYK